MDLEAAIRIEGAAPDSHFRLLPCPECGGDNVAYVQYMLGIQEPWKVRCFDCGYTVDQQKIFKHEAQVEWNSHCRKKREKPCMDCPDRYTACSDHCRKAAFLQWKEDRARQRRQQEQAREIDNYTIGEIRKNRRVR